MQYMYIHIIYIYIYTYIFVWVSVFKFKNRAFQVTSMLCSYTGIAVVSTCGFFLTGEDGWADRYNEKSTKLSVRFVHLPATKD